MYEELEEQPEMNSTVSSGLTLESVSRLLGNEIVVPILEFIQPKLGSENWIDRYVGMIAFGSILDGPDSQYILNCVGNNLEAFLQMINDPV